VSEVESVGVNVPHVREETVYKAYQGQNTCMLVKNKRVQCAHTVRIVKRQIKTWQQQHKATLAVHHPSLHSGRGTHRS
jgi:Mor family transcriptional regulator